MKPEAKKKRNRYFFMFIFSLLFLALTCSVTADDSGQCGENVFWEFNETTGFLNISGTGDMTSKPWISQHGKYIKSLEIGYGVTSIMKRAFTACPISSEIIIPDEKELSKFLLEKGDLLFARQSLVAEGAGKCSYVNNLSEETTCQE